MEASSSSVPLNVCPAATDMLGFSPQESPSPAPRKSLRRASSLPPLPPKARLDGGKSLRGEAKLGSMTVSRLHRNRATSFGTQPLMTKESSKPMLGQQTASKTEQEPVEIK